MRKRIALYTTVVVLLVCGLLPHPFQSEAFIQKRYSLEEIINACTNIIFGTVTEVSTERMTAKVRVEENLKGKSGFKEIQINIAVGQGNFPRELIKKCKVGLPIIVFYAKQGRRINSLGHVNGTWFKTHAHDKADKSRVWWNFTHIEIYMPSTYNGTTADFQTLLRGILAGKIKPKPPQTAAIEQLAQAAPGTVRTLMLTGNQYDVVFPILSEFGRVGHRKIAYQKTKDRELADLNHADILWIGHGEICESKYFLTPKTENKIKTFVKNGGVVIVSGQDSDDERPCNTGWLPHPLTGVERWGRSDFQPTRAAGTLFSKPNTIQSGAVFIDDAWTGWNDKYTLLATTNGGKDIAVAMLTHGKGMYLITSFRNETGVNIFVNRPMMENLIHFAVKWLNSRT